MSHRLLIISLAAALSACAPKAPEPAATAPTPSPAATPTPVATGIDTAALHRHMKTLADDSFGGRQPGGKGEPLTTDYLVAEFQAAGLEPGNNGSWLQAVPYIGIQTLRSPSFEITGKDGAVDYAFPSEVVIGSRTGQTRVEVKAAPLVFAGYGVTAPESDWGDFDGVDVAGKAVIVVVNDPGFHAGDESLFKGREMTYYGRWTYKYEECARRQAAACLIVHDDAGAGYGYDVVQSSFGQRMQFELDGDASPRTPIVGWLSGAAARALFARAGMDYEAELKAANTRGFRARPVGDLVLDAAVDSAVSRGSSNNVLARITGKSRPDEWVIVTGHWDHLGQIPAPEGGDGIFNGAIDNATGIAAMLEIAKKLVDGGGTERSVLFLPVTLEESGLIGSRYYAENPVYPLAQTVAVVNIDAMRVGEPTADLEVIGYGQSELDDVLKRHAEATGRRVVPNSEPEKGFYYRSDHFSFAFKGVPALYFKGGFDVIGKGPEYGKAQSDDYLLNRYHKPGDEYDANWDLTGMAQDVALTLAVTRDLADGTAWPNFAPASEFRAARDAMRPPAAAP
jgi:Zn-dependent M28 family amino/carboxypeptidase